MATLVKQLQSGKRVVFDKGRFDKWCVYIVESNGYRKAPLDEIYFNELHKISETYAKNKVYEDFISIYRITTKEIDNKALGLIDEISTTYREKDRINIEQWLAVIYAGMIAEENKANAVLKKRIKRLGMHQVLVEGIAPEKAAKFSYGKRWQELDTVMKEYGF